MSRYRWEVSLALLALFATETVAADDPGCFENVISCAEDSSGLDCTSGLNISDTAALSVLRTSNGSLIPPLLSAIEAATALSYAGCVQYCGSGPVPFSWNDFSQEYSAWLLPYLALLSQLPFGAQRRRDNLMSMVLTLGSPTLAGYSLFLTLLNARWVNVHLFSDVHYPNAVVRRSVVRVLSSLQQIPLRIHPGEGGQFESLVVHPDNDAWWITFAEELGYSSMWSLASAISIACVVIAYLLAVAYSISTLADDYSNAEGTTSGLLWLLPIVVGWLILSPKCDYGRVLDAYNKANKKAFAADSHDPTETPALVTSKFGLTIASSPHRKPRSDIISPDESRIPPIFNYARVWLWSRNVYITSLFYRAASEKSSNRIGIGGELITGSVHSDVPRGSRLGTRDEIVQYCHPDYYECPGSSNFLPPGVVYNMVVASLMALQLQWGTTGAAFLGAWYTPTTGLGCRSFVYLLYGVLSTMTWILLVLSSLLGYCAHHLLNIPSTSDVESAGNQPPSTHSPCLKSSAITSPTDDSPALSANTATPLHETRSLHDTAISPHSDGPTGIAPKRPRATWISARTLGWLADWLRWTGKAIAIVNAVGTIANSCFEYAGLYNTCFCDSSLYTQGAHAFVTFAPSSSDFALLESAWIGALALASGCCMVFVGSIFLPAAA